MKQTFAVNYNIYSFTPQQLIPLKSDIIWLLKGGQVKSFIWNEQGNSITLGYWGSGDVVGKSLSITKDPQQIQCLTPVEAYCIPCQRWYCLAEQICHHARQSQELLAIVRTPKVHDRLQQFLLWLSDKFGYQDRDGKLVDVRLTHQEIAEAIGTTRVTITKLLNQLEEEGLIRRPRRHFILLTSGSGE